MGNNEPCSGGTGTVDADDVDADTVDDDTVALAAISEGDCDASPSESERFFRAEGVAGELTFVESNATRRDNLETITMNRPVMSWVNFN